MYTVQPKTENLSQDTFQELILSIFEIATESEDAFLDIIQLQNKNNFDLDELQEVSKGSNFDYEHLDSKISKSINYIRKISENIINNEEYKYFIKNKTTLNENYLFAKNCLKLIIDLNKKIKELYDLHFDLQKRLESEGKLTIKSIAAHHISVNLKLSIYNILIESKNYLKKIQESKNPNILRNEKENNLEYISNFKADTQLIIKEYKNEISNLTNNYDNQFKNFKLDQAKVSKSNQLLINSVNEGLEKLANLDEKIQILELNFSRILKDKELVLDNEIIKLKDTFFKKMDEISTESINKSNELTTTHSDFKNLVENAGIYNLTENYNKKANEEKTEYQKFRTYTGCAIGAAIFFTILILLIPLIEYWGNETPNDTNYYMILVRLTISLMFFVLALYFSKQAAKHYECYQENNRTFLQLAALEPFISRMNESDKLEIRKGLIPSYFNQNIDGKFATKDDEVDISNNMYGILSKIIDLVPSNKDQKNKDANFQENRN